MKKLILLLCAVFLTPLALQAGEIADISQADLAKAIETKIAALSI